MDRNETKREQSLSRQSVFPYGYTGGYVEIFSHRDGLAASRALRWTQRTNTLLGQKRVHPRRRCGPHIATMSITKFCGSSPRIFSVLQESTQAPFSKVQFHVTIWRCSSESLVDVPPKILSHFTVCCSHVWSSWLIQVAQKTRLVSWIFPNKKIDDWKEEWMALYQNVNEVMVFTAPVTARPLRHVVQFAIQTSSASCNL